MLKELNETNSAQAVQFEISDFGFEMQDSSNFKISSQHLPGKTCSTGNRWYRIRPNSILRIWGVQCV